MMLKLCHLLETNNYVHWFRKIKHNKLKESPAVTGRRRGVESTDSSRQLTDDVDLIRQNAASDDKSTDVADDKRKNPGRVR